MAEAKSRFGTNLLALFFLNLFFTFFRSMMYSSSYDGVGQFFSVASSITSAVFGFGLLYALFRAAGVRAPAIEAFYQHVPLGLMNAERVSHDGYGGTYKKVQPNGGDMPEGNFDWHQLLSFKYLRAAGVMLIILSLFSLFFRIEWSLREKVILAAICGVVFYIVAEMMRAYKKGQFASMASLLGFALLQFACTLSISLFATMQVPAMIQNPLFWIIAKIVLVFAFLFSLKRYNSSFQAVGYFLVAYSMPFTLMEVNALPSFTVGMAYIIIMTVLVLSQVFMQRNIGLTLVNAAGAGCSYLVFYTGYSHGAVMEVSVPVLALGLALAVFILHLITVVPIASMSIGDAVMQRFHVIAIHGIILTTMFMLQWDIKLLNDYIGVAYLILAAITFTAYMAAHAKKIPDAVSETLINLAIIISAIGLFVQIKGPWTAIIFLSYACLLLFYCLYNTYLRTRIYAFVVLTVSLVKLVMEFSDIFSSISGTVATMIIGVVLILLSFKFEAIKDLVLKGGGRK